MAYIAGAILEKLDNGKEHKVIKKDEVIAFSIGGIFMVIAYFFAGAIIAAFLTGNVGLIQGLVLAAKDIGTNIVQVSVGIVLAMPLSLILIPIKKRIFN